MSVCKRVLARLDIKGSKLIKGVRFEGVRVIGNAYEVAKKYANLGVDEIFYSDAVASLYGRNSLYDLLKQTCKDVFVPITAGGAINSIEDGRKLLASGADKLAINTGVVRNPSLINDLANEFGTQCVVVSIQARKSCNSNSWELMIEGGREKCDKNLITWIEEVQARGAGEIILTSVDNDGIGEGTDHDLIRKVQPSTKIPLVIGGGIGSEEEITKIFNTHKSLSGISIGWSFHNDHLDINKVNKAIQETKCETRLSKNTSIKSNITETKVIIVDYSMGNLESLSNGLKKIGIDAVISSEESEIMNADLVFLPGVGSFYKGMRNLNSRKLINPLLRRANEGKAIIGICLGMQLLFQEGEEYQPCQGLGIIKGKIKKLPNKSSNNEELVLPHVGWNKLYIDKKYENSNLRLFDKSYQYFVHSYAYQPEKTDSENTLFKSNYGGKDFISAVKYKSCVGLQFHPERSGYEGLNLLNELIKSLIKI